MTLVHTKENSRCPFPLCGCTVHLPSSFLSPLLVAVVFVRLGKITKSCFVRGCSCWNPTRSSWREKGAGGSTTPPCRSQNIRLQICASLPHLNTYILRAPLPHPRTHTNKHYTMSKHTNTHKTEMGEYAHVRGLPQWKYCPLKQVCITGIFQVVGECWQKLEKQQKL